MKQVHFFFLPQGYGCELLYDDNNQTYCHGHSNSILVIQPAQVNAVVRHSPISHHLNHFGT